jgi:hypothetical protein
VITYLNPAVAVALGVSVLGERFTPAMAGAFALILGGSVLATRPGLRRRAPSPGAPPPVGPGAPPPVTRGNLDEGGSLSG